MSLEEWEDQVQQWDNAPLAQEAQIRRAALTLDGDLAGRTPPAKQEARWWRLRSRLACFQDWAEGLESARRSVHWAAHHQQWEELEETLDYLRGLESLEPQAASAHGDTARLVQSTLRLASCTTLAQLRQVTVETGLELTSLGQLAWLERVDGRWEAQAWLPVQNWPFYSEQVLTRCRSAGATLFGDIREMGDSRSLLLSDLRMMVAVPLQSEQQFFGILYSELEESGLQTGNLRILECLAGIVAATAQRLVVEEQTRWAFEQADYLNRLRQKLAASTSLGLALADREGRLLQWNAAYASLWEKPPSPGSYIWEMFPGKEQIIDRKGQSGVRLSLLRTRGGRRWLQINDWWLETEDKRVRCILDLTAQEPEQWSGFLEEMRHELAADLHDGPAQTAAARRLEEGGDRAWSIILARIQALRSPWMEGRDPELQLHSWLQNCLPADCRLDIGWQGGLEEAWSRQCYRLLQTLCEEVNQVSILRSLRLRVTDEECSLIWVGRNHKTLPPVVLEWVKARVNLSETDLAIFLEKGQSGKISVFNRAPGN